MSELIKIDTDYADWIKEISTQFKTSQIKAASIVNEEMLRFYWFIGKGISKREERNQYGSNFYKVLSQDLSAALPGIKSFSSTNLRYMKHFYHLCEMFPQVEGKSEVDANLPQAGGKSAELLFMIPWGHMKLIIDKCKGNKERSLF